MTQSAVRQPVPVGQYFLDRGKISAQQLALALQHREGFGLKLGQSLVELGFVTEADMVEALRHQARFPCIHLTSGIVEARVAAKLGETVSRRLRALALNQIAGHTTVALEDPSDPQALEELAHILATRIFPVYAEPSVILGLLDQVFGAPKSRVASHDVPSAPASRAVLSVPREVPERVPLTLTGATATGAATAGTATAVAAPAGAATAGAATAGAAPEDRAVVDCVRGFLQQAFEQRASDVHLEARRDELTVRFRVDGALHEHSRLPGSWVRPVSTCLKALAHIGSPGDVPKEGESPQAREGTISFLFRKQNYEVRVAILSTLHGESAVLHVLGSQREHRDLGHLGLAHEQLTRLEAILAARDGLFFVAGPAGSGRTTTLNAVLARQATRDRKVLVLAEHLDNELDGVLYVRDAGHAKLDPAARVQALLSQDPDLLVVPEIEGDGLARSLLAAALEGHSILAGQRARSALEALTRLVHLGLEPYLLADVVRGVLAQRLVRRICTGCKTPIAPDDALCTRLDLPSDGATYFVGEGCEACHGTGFSQRLGLFEVLSVTSGLRRELEKGANPEALAQAAQADGFMSLRAHGLSQARAGLTTLHEVLVATAGG